MTDPLRARLAALITEMRAQGQTEAWDAASFHWADEIEAALRAAPEDEHEVPLTKRVRYLARRGADPALRTAMTNARLVVNDWHACATSEELHRWRQAQQALIEAAIAVGRDLERNAAHAAALEGTHTP